MQQSGCQEEVQGPAARALGRLGAVDGRKGGGCAGVEHTQILAVLRRGVDGHVGAGADAGAGAGRAVAVHARKLLVHALNIASVACTAEMLLVLKVLPSQMWR